MAKIPAPPPPNLIATIPDAAPKRSFGNRSGATAASPVPPDGQDYTFPLLVGAPISLELGIFVLVRYYRWYLVVGSHEISMRSLLRKEVCIGYADVAKHQMVKSPYASIYRITSRDGKVITLDSSLLDTAELARTIDAHRMGTRPHLPAACRLGTLVTRT